LQSVVVKVDDKFELHITWMAPNPIPAIELWQQDETLMIWILRVKLHIHLRFCHQKKMLGISKSGMPTSWKG
jgi:hypothetical protein